jgi:MinD superfamily P-loop ATPase
MTTTGGLQEKRVVEEKHECFGCSNTHMTTTGGLQEKRVVEEKHECFGCSACHLRCDGYAAAQVSSVFYGIHTGEP